MMKKCLALTLAVVLVLGCFAGCGKKDAAEGSTGAPGTPAASTGTPAENQGNVAMGRYVEQELPLPESGYALDMVQLKDGRIRVAVYGENDKVLLHTTNADGTDWEDTQTLPEEIGQSGNSSQQLALSPDGSVFCATHQENPEDKTYTHHLWMVDPEGTARELPLDGITVDPAELLLLTACDFTADGQLRVVRYFDELMELDSQSGTFGENCNDLGLFLRQLAGANVVLTHDAGYRLCQEGLTPLEGVVGEQVKESLKYTEGMSPKVSCWENSDGYLFFTTHDGLYSYVPEGSVTEMLVDGARTSLGDPSFFPMAMTGKPDNSFFVMGSINGGEARLYRYVYDPNTPTQASTQLRLYTLYEDEELRQMVSQYQKANQDVAITLEVGLTGDNGMTEGDAIRALNTEILSGKGPDLIRLDGMNLDTFLEKGLLIDLTPALKEPLLEQVSHCYAQNGQVCALTTGFAIPAMYGPGHIVSQIHDLDSLVAALQQAKQENTKTRTVINGILPVMTADIFYDSCSAAWVREDGTLDEEKLAQFYAAMQQVYGVDEEYRQANAEMLNQWAAEGVDYTPGDYTGLSGAIMVLMGAQSVTAGTLEGVEPWSWLLAGDDQLEGYETAPISLQSSGVFLPVRIMGVLNTSANQQAALDFISYMLGKEGQETANDSFPVNQAVFDQQIAEDKVSDMSMGSSDDEGNYVEVNGIWPDARRRQELKGWVDNLTTPALPNRIIRQMVMEPVTDCLNGKITPEEAAQKAIKNLNLYLSE